MTTFIGATSGANWSRRQAAARSSLVSDSPTLLLAVAGWLVLALAGTGSRAFQYDVWFKYPHPYTQTEPLSFCAPDSQAAAAKAGCQTSVPIFVNTLDSPRTLIPYTVSQLIDFCNLQEAREYEHSQHSEWDDNIRLAPFDVKWLRNDECRVLCNKSYKMGSHADVYRLEELKLALTRDYYHHWFADTLPFSWCYRARECFIGFPVGYSTDARGSPDDERVPIGNFTKPSALFVFNHFDLTFYYESGETKAWSGKFGQQLARITSLRVAPRSIDHEQSQSGNRCAQSAPPLEVPPQLAYGSNASLQLTYSYSVRFVEDQPGASWAQRWRQLERALPASGRAKWVLATAVALLLASSLAAAYAIARTLLADRPLISVNPRDEADSVAWKQLAGDIFREPVAVSLFSVLVGSGCQFVVSVLLSEFFSAFIAFFSTSLLVLIVVLFVIVHGFVGGYAAARLYRTFGGDQWRAICAWVTLLNPLVVFCMLVMARNLLFLYNGSSMALNVGLFGSVFMVAVCFAFSLPSTLAGGHVGFRAAAIEFPCRPTANQRQLRDQQVWKEPLASTALTGLVPLVCFWCVEAYPFYDSGGYVITVITIVIVINLSVAHCYYHLARYDYRWWWRSYLACGLAAIYYFVHCLVYIFANLYVDNFANALLYMASPFFISLALFILTGTIGFLVTFGFVWQAYASLNCSPDMNYAMFQKSGQLE